MARAAVGTLIGNTSGAAAATVALALIGMIAAGGIAFDYARMAALDSELQNAADQAALAAATQLDGQTGACDRAIAAARSLVANQTHANDAAGFNVSIATVTGSGCTSTGGVKFFSVYNDTTKTPATGITDAKFVAVTTATRKAVYALTPVVALFSGDLSDTAVAGLGTAICKVPPVMICNPNESGDPTFTTANYVGKGVVLQSGAYTPGNFGFLKNNGDNGASGLSKAIGWDTAPGECLPQSGVDTKTGVNSSVYDAFNTRFDIYPPGQTCPSGGNCPPSINTVKDLLRPNGASGNNSCTATHNQGWQEASPNNKLYLPNSTNALTPSTLTPDVMGHPRDMCHAAASTATNYCTGRIGTGAWDRDTYFRANYGCASGSAWQTGTGLGANATRYQVYAWEIANRSTTLCSQTVLGTRTVGSLRAHGSPVCSQLQIPNYGSGTIPGGTVVDRRRMSVAVVNCTANGVNGSSTNVPVQKWIDVFLVEPSYSRSAALSGSHARSSTGATDLYVEVIGETASGANGATAGQTVRRDKPYLVE